MTTTETTTETTGEVYCRSCGWLVPAEGIYLAPEVDRPSPGARPERCQDTACVSDAVCDSAGAE